MLFLIILRYFSVKSLKLNLMSSFDFYFSKNCFEVLPKSCFLVTYASLALLLFCNQFLKMSISCQPVSGNPLKESIILFIYRTTLSYRKKEKKCFLLSAVNYGRYIRFQLWDSIYLLTPLPLLFSFLLSSSPSFYFCVSAQRF